MRAKHERVVARAGEQHERVDSIDASLAVHLQLGLSVGQGQHQLLTVLIGRKLRHLNRDRAHGPEALVAPATDGPVRWLDQPLQRGFEALYGAPIAALEDRAARGDVDALIAGRVALRSRDDVPLSGAREARDAGLDPAERARIRDVFRRQSTCGSIRP